MKQVIQCDKAPQAIGSYSQLVKAENMIYSSGQIALDPETGKLVGSLVREQSQRVMKNIAILLQECQLNFSDVVKVTIYLKNMADFKSVNDVYQSYFCGNYPARSTVEVSALPKGALVEIDFIACCS